MSYIDWNAAKPKKRGGPNPNIMGKIYYRDEKSKVSKQKSYRISLYKSAPDALKSADAVVFGVSKNDCFLSTKNMPKVPRFNVSNSSSGGISIYGENMVKKTIDILTGLDPEGDLILTFDLEKVDETTYKFINLNIE